MSSDFPVELHCPNTKCRQRFLLETDGTIARGVCPSCGGEVVYRSKERRDEDLTLRKAHSKVLAKT